MADSRALRPGGRSGGFTLTEILIAMVLAGILGSLALQAMVDLHRFYGKVSQQSREVGNATIALDRLENFAFGLPRQAFTLTTNSNGQGMLVIQPFNTLAASGTAVYSTKRWVVENSVTGVWLWSIEGESSALGSPLAAFPPPTNRGKKGLLLGPKWSFKAEFEDGRFPLRLTVAPPSSDARAFTRDIEGYL